jgi:asparagine synthase (glutamine-hydrolysing)
MCGICGFLSKKDVSIDSLRDMNVLMRHRGPNDSGEEIYSVGGGYYLGLGQCRLSILDLSEKGHQPMHSIDKRISLVFNGEIYNYREIRSQLSDYTFISDCDTEVIIAAYLKWGISFVDKMNGMFAISLYDRKEDKLYLIRDRIGKKPLYYYLHDEEIVYASELKPIMSYPHFSKQINMNVMPTFLIQQYINAPDTIFDSVYKVKPGQIVEFSKGIIKTFMYWDLFQVYSEKKLTPVKNYDTAKEELKDLLVTAVKKRLIADVPVGSFLSGGYDSSLMSAIAQEVFPGKLKTYSVGFHDEEFNEAIYAKEIAKHLGTDHKELYVNEQDMFDALDDLVFYYDEPFADSSQIPTMLVSKLAKEDVTVTLSGDGGDELFCGYGVYDLVKKAQKLDVLGGLLYQGSKLPLIRKMNLLEHLPVSVRTISLNRNKMTKTQLLSNTYEKNINAICGITDGIYRFPIELDIKEKDWQVKRMLVDMVTYLPGDILCKVDRASMKYSLEARCPILDKEIIEYSFRLPHEFKYNNGNKKHILKDIAYDYIPKEMLERPKKGFAIPLDKWLRSNLKEQLTEFSRKEYLKNQNLFNPKYTEIFVDNYISNGDLGAYTGANYSKIIWSFYVFQKWFQRYM